MAYGNNDSKYHYSGPFKEDKEEFYNFMFDLWFNKHKANQKFAQAAKDTYMNGGYYRVDINDKVSVLAMNTLYFNKK